METKNLKSRLQSYVEAIDPDDTLCNKCLVKGTCCYGAINKSGRVIGLKSLACKHLNKSGTCDVYKDRHKLVRSCLDMPDAILQRALPNECEYVKGLEGYRGKEIAGKDLEKSLLPEFVKGTGGNTPDFVKSEIKELIKKHGK